MKKALGLVMAVAMTASAALATDLNVAVQTDTGLDTINVAAGVTVNYQVVGVLSDTANEGLALFGFDLVFDGGTLTQAEAPLSGPIANFVIPEGITNPAGFGGTDDVPGREGELVQIGGAQNTIKNDVGNAPYPMSAVVHTLLGHTEVVLATGSLTAPMTDGTYTLALTNLFANVIKEGENESGTFWAVEEAGVGTIENLTVEVGAPCIIVSTDPPNCEIDAAQSSAPDGSAPRGWNTIEFNFNACDLTGLAAEDFTVSVEPSGTAPTISDVVVAGDKVTLTLSGPIPTGSWTCFEFSGSMETKCIGWLPADVTGDKTAAPSDDILRVINCLNGDATCEMWQCDVDASGVCGPPDILRVIDLLNGAGVYDPWLNLSIPACPSE